MQHYQNMDNYIFYISLTSIKKAYINMIFLHITCYSIKQQHTKWPQSRTHKHRAPLGPFMAMNHFWFHLSPNHCGTKTHNKTRRCQSQDQNKISTLSRTVRNQSQKFPIFSPKILGLNHPANHDPKENLCQLMDFKLKIIQIGKFSTSWSLTKLPDFRTHA